MRLQIPVVLLLSAVTLAGCLAEDEADPIVVGDEPVLDRADDGHPDFEHFTAMSMPEVGDTDASVPEHWLRIEKRPLPESIAGIELLAEGPLSTGAGIAMFGQLALVSEWGNENFNVLSVEDPEDPTLLGTAQTLGGDVDTIAYPDGTLVAVVATRGKNINVVDITEPTDPQVIASIDTPNGNHNLAIVPGSPIVYNAVSNGAGGGNDIWDLTDPNNPVMVQDWDNGYGCHAISFFMDQERELYRGYCAGVENVQIWDVTDARDPTVITDFGWPTGGVHGAGGVAPASFAHLAMVNHDASILILGDETGGGAAPGCDVYQNVMGNTVAGPLGNLWFYDISDEANPVLQGSLSPSAVVEATGSCTAHFGSVIEDTNHLVMAYYTGGVLLVDFTDPQNPVIKDQWTPYGPQDACTLCGTWDVWYYQGYLFTGDISRGIDVLGLV